MMVVAVVALVAEWAGDSTPPAPMQGVAWTTGERERWAVDFLAGLGNETPSADTVTMVVEWTIAEDSSMDAFTRNNPLNTTQDGFEETQVINSDGVRGYSTRDAGLFAALHTVTNGLYNDVVTALLANDAAAARRALWASPWAGSHYGYGAGWLTYTPRVSSAKFMVTPTMEVGAHFDTADCGAWGFQAGCRHWGTDLPGAEGTPVYAPFDLTVIALGGYGTGPTMGQYVQGTFADGYVFYAGHLESRQRMSVGETLPAGTLLGFTNSLAHTHVQLAEPGNAGACAQDGTCVDFERYFEEH